MVAGQGARRIRVTATLDRRVVEALDRAAKRQAGMRARRTARKTRPAIIISRNDNCRRRT